MILWTIFRFEFGYQLRRPWPWLFVLLLLFLAFLMTRDGALAEVLYADFFLNSPFAVAKTTVFGFLVWLVMAAAIAGEAGARDVATRMHPLTYTTPASKAEYLGGRLLAALVLNAGILLAVQAGILLGVYLPGVEAALIGPFRPAAFLTAHAFIVLPSAFVATALQFALAVGSGRAMASYFGSFLLVFMGFFVAEALLYHHGIGALLDPIGIRFVVEDMGRLWTPLEKNRRLLALTGTVLTNRLLWLGAALLLLALTYGNFRFAHRRSARQWWKRWTLRRSAPPRQAAPNGAGAGILMPLPPVPRTFRFVFHARQTLAIAGASLRTTALSWAGFALLAALPLLTVPVLLDQMASNGVPLVPTTVRIVSELTGSLSDELSRWVIIPFLIIFFAGELVWRERDAGLGELTDALPGSEWAPLLGKFLGLSLLLTLFMALQMMAGMLAQLIRGYDNFELPLYLKILFGLQLPDYLLVALLALVVHVMVDQKYLGHLVAVLAYVFIALASMFGVEHNLLIYGASPGWSYTDMRGFGSSLEPWLWFKLYWAAWALLLAVGARLLWGRGQERSLGQRLQLARRRFTRPVAWTTGAAGLLVLALGGFIFYNTNVRNEYRSAADIKERSAAYERRYGRYAKSPQPRQTATSLHIEIYPGQRAVDIRGTYHLVNHHAVAIDSLHVVTVPGVETQALVLDRTAVSLPDDEAFFHRIYVLKQPLQPGDSLQLDFRVHVAPRGFRESGVDASVGANGTHFTNAWLPTIGYQTSRELISASDRRAYGLAPRPLIASLYNVEARQARGTGGGNLDVVVGTADSQIAVAPGALRRTWVRGGRRYFHYTTNGPTGSDWAFFSAHYAVREEHWKNPDGSGQVVAIRIFHQPQHTAHLPGLLRGIRSSLDYYTKNFGPYRRSYLSVVEGAGNGTGMHAETGMLSYGEGFSLWNQQAADGSLDFPFAVVAHEMAHQWTVPYANVEGAPVMSESLAWYYALKVAEHAREPGYLERLRSYLRQPETMAPIRRGEPLLRGLDQYMSYRKGPFALYALSEYVGEEQINGALRRLRDNHRKPSAPLATTLDLYRELQVVTPDSLRYLLRDLFEVNTFWELKTERATAAQTTAGTWLVALEVQARKVVVDSAGVETEVPMDDWVEVGVFAPAEKGQPSDQPLYLQKQRLRSGPQTITVPVPRKPTRAGLDPQHLLIDLKMEDNLKEVGS